MLLKEDGMKSNGSGVFWEKAVGKHTLATHLSPFHKVSISMNTDLI